ncbi:MAG TPA: insulinase family protein [Terriglobales bacterium]|nr:insulinase family protein [Terriglobales bacterium]
MQTTKNLFAVALVLIFSHLAVAQTAAKPAASRPAVAKDYRKIPKRPLPPFKPQQPVRIQLENGMVLFLQEDHELPFIDGTMRIRGGGRDVPATKTGMMGIYAETWRTGGTKDKTGDQLDEYLESRAAAVEAGGGGDSTSLSFSSLKKDFDEVFGIFLSVLREPAFRQDKIDLEKRQTKSLISRRNDDVGDIASREATKLAYGADSPYARQAEYWTIDAINRDDLVAWHKNHVHPNNIILGIVGDFDPKQMEARLRKEFASWPKGPAVEKQNFTFKDPRPGVYFVEKDDVNQSTINLLTLGMKRNDPDYYAAQVMNELFGQSSASRLFVNIRTRKGLAYSVGGGIGANYDYPGVFRLAMGTKSEQTLAAIEALYEEIDDLVKNPGTALEVQRAKDNILNSFIFNFDSKNEVLREKMAYEFYGYPQDFLDRFRTEIEKVTPGDVARVVKKYVDRNKFAILVVGKSADFGKPLSTLGQVHPVDITIRTEPGAPAGEKPAAAGAGSVESNPAGKALIAKVVQALGGKEKLEGIKTIQQSQAQMIKTPQGDLNIDSTATLAYPDRMYVNMSTPMGEMVRVITPAAAFASMGGQVQNMPDSMKADQLRDLKRDMLVILQHADDPAYRFAASDKSAAGTGLDIETTGGPVHWLVDDSGKVLKASFKTTSQAGPVQREIEFSDYRTVEGLTLPFKRVTKDNGNVVAETTVKEIKLNPAVDPKLFEKP